MTISICCGVVGPARRWTPGRRGLFQVDGIDETDLGIIGERIASTLCGYLRRRETHAQMSFVVWLRHWKSFLSQRASVVSARRFSDLPPCVPDVRRPAACSRQADENLSIGSVAPPRDDAFGRTAGCHHGVNACADNNRVEIPAGQIAVTDQANTARKRPRMSPIMFLHRRSRSSTMIVKSSTSRSSLFAIDFKLSATGASRFGKTPLNLWSDDHFFHVNVGRVQQAAFFANWRERRWRLLRLWGRNLCATARSDKISTTGKKRFRRIVASPTFSPM